MNDGSEFNLTVKQHLKEQDAMLKKHEALSKRFDEFYDRFIIEEAKRRDRLNSSLFKRFMKWVRND